MSLCQYKHALGVPGEGVHAARLGPFALWDVVGTVVGGYAVSRVNGSRPMPTIVATFVVGHLLHIAFCVDTAAVRAFNAF